MKHVALIVGLQTHLLTCNLTCKHPTQRSTFTELCLQPKGCWILREHRPKRWQCHVQVWSLQTIPADPADPAAAQHDLSAQGAVISPVPDKGRICKEFTNIVAAWEQDLISVVRQGTMVSGISGAPGWRIDNQENGLTGPRGPNRLRCNSIAVQKEGGPRNVYANVLVPNGYNIGKRRIRHALLQSQKCKKMVLLYVPKAQADQLPAQSDPHRADHFVQGLPWTIMMLDGASAVLA